MQAFYVISTKLSRGAYNYHGIYACILWYFCEGWQINDLTWLTNNVIKSISTIKTVLGNVNASSRSLYAVARQSVCPLSSVCLSSVTFVHHTQPAEIFGKVSTSFGTLAIRWHPPKILRRSSQGTPLSGGRGLNARRVAEYSDFGHRRLYLGNSATYEVS